ncbi:uncharacterized protein K452DRAFT_49694 [Aplosporella prunicola CBS 121167]|uniref:dual-specificity kinase n=1 Tax=Aplosporella prunicola CBS 121167 TaxID=1176127 RepID=A0A6A6BBC6_9PEZI|nr:uncharacterized protein K452DRAFT_49694 [Aplosporella prunicola CBS 121167]KAF2140663.1 hypothetical protein K452DRAFT_49694 [Aplosporella prunicola CBS 121167]
MATRTGDDESGSSGAEGRAPRKFHDHPLRKGSAQMAPGSSNTFAGRRRSTLREHKAPLGPRPLDQGRRRIVSGSTAASSNASRLPTSQSDDSFPPNSTGSNPRFSFGRLPNRVESTGSFDFLPSANFDDLHESITSADLSDFPVPGGGRGIFAHHDPPHPDYSLDPDDLDPSDNPSMAAEDRKLQGSRAASSAGRTTSSSRHQPSRNDVNPSPMAPPAALPLSARNRRQSQFPGPAPVPESAPFSATAARGPRKSLGPGLLSGADAAGTGSYVPRRDFSHGHLGRSGSNSKPRRGTLVPSYSSSDVPRLSNNTMRSNKAKSMLQPSGTSFDPLGANTRSPAKTPRAITPSKRQSLHHAGGLGARTISPTDARRLKRLSLHSNSTTTRTPPTPQPDLQQEPLPTSYSPALVFRKSVTPSSARATPDKSLAPAPPLSNSSSFSSLRGNGSTSARSSQILSGSRLPTPKSRNVHSSAGPEPEEDVPPVPAIPKVFESPNTEIDQPVYPVRQTPATPAEDANWAAVGGSNTDSETTKPSLSKTAKATDLPANDNKKPQGGIAGRRARGMTVGASSDADKRAPATNVGKKNLQPLRLPPLNLLPLSTPTTAKISTYRQPNEEVDPRETTTPPPKRATKTPSTPMTASKATFSQAMSESTPANPELRSATSHFHLRSTETPSYPPPPPMPLPVSTPADGIRAANTPYSSPVQPKNDDDTNDSQSGSASEGRFGTVDEMPQNTRLNGPRAPANQVGQKNDASSTTSTEPETPSSGSSLRRKLSMGWKRSSSKSSHRTQASQSNINSQTTSEQPPQPPKHNEMPAPKLAPSSTWNGTSTSTQSPSPLVKPRPSAEHAPRRKPSGALFATDAQKEQTIGTSKVAGPPKTASVPYEQSSGPTTRSASSSMMHRMLGSKNSTSMLKSRNTDPNMDKDDLAADEEMRRLGSRRKDFEAAAKELDELRRRAKPQERVLPAHALQMVPLNIFERGEIIDYKEIYFCGTKNAKKRIGDLHSSTANFGYDDDRGDYQIVLGDHLAYRYEVVDVLGKGSFGQVVRCVDHKTGKLVAIKIIRNKKRFHQQALVEVNILQKLRDWDPENKHSMINFTQHFYFRGHLCISTELLGMNLYEFIKAHEFKGFSLKLIRRFAKQILSSLCLLKTKRVIHCDLKPENILLAHPLQSEIKVIDFGSSCFENEKVYTYIQSRFYRSPEVILGMSYGLPIDMWSFGCILAELLTGSPIFPGENEQEQLACIMEIFGPPEKHLIEKSSRKKLFFDSLGKPRVTVSSKGRRRRPSSKTLEQALKCNDDAFLDFITRCLRWDPDRRLKPEDAMYHEFITGVKRPRVPMGRQTANSASTASPVKRFNTVSQTPGRGGTRPLPEPPGNSTKSTGVSGTAAATAQGANRNSPLKAAAPRRQSTVSGLTNNFGMKRSSNNTTGGAQTGSQGQTSSLPRVAQRSVSGKPDLASAAAVASLRSR